MRRSIEIRPHKKGWCCFEGPGVEPYWVGESAKESALSYGTERAKTDGSEVRILNEAGELAETFRFKEGDFETI